MKLTYDPKYNIGYIQFREKGADVETIRVSDELNIDLAPDGAIYGIELLNAREQLAGDKVKKFIMENASTGKTCELELPL